VCGQIVVQGTERKSAAHVEGDLERELDAIDALLGSPGPFLLGDRPWLCDFALLGQLAYLSRPPRSARALAARPAIGRYLQLMRDLRGEDGRATTRGREGEPS
jgi:glutathione S-transferase